MPAWTPLIGFGAFLLASLVVAARLLLLWRRTRRLPELAMGIALLFSGPVGYLQMQLAISLVAQGSPLGPALWGSGLISVSVGAVALYLFTWKVFRPQGPLGPALLALGIFAMGAGWIGTALTEGFEHVGLHGAWAYVGFCGRLVSFAWAAAETLLYWAKLRRRGHLGLVEPLVVNRFLLWGIAASAATGIFLFNLARSLSGEPDLGASSVLAVGGLLGLTAAGCLWLAFFPPAAYRRFAGRPKTG